MSDETPDLELAAAEYRAAVVRCNEALRKLLGRNTIDATADIAASRAAEAVKHEAGRNLLRIAARGEEQ